MFEQRSPNNVVYECDVSTQVVEDTRTLELRITSKHFATIVFGATRHAMPSVMSGEATTVATVVAVELLVSAIDQIKELNKIENKLLLLYGVLRLGCAKLFCS